jgi:hypothetical protein
MLETVGQAYKGQKVWIYKANMIIPQIARAEKKDLTISMFSCKNCPICGERTELKDNDGVLMLYCSNPQCEGKLVNKFKLDHNDVHIERGVWRKFNPYNPYQEGDDGNSSGPNSLESLDDLFSDDDTSSGSSSTSTSTSAASGSNNTGGGSPIKELTPEEEKRQEELTDIQKELEAKFDELFGSIDD